MGLQDTSEQRDRPVPWPAVVGLLAALLVAASSGSQMPLFGEASWFPESCLEVRADGACRLSDPPGPASDQNPAFSPDGSRLVFTRFDIGYNNGPACLMVLDLASRQLVRITPQEDQDNVNLPGAAWSGRHDRIIFASDRHDADDLWQVAPDGSELARVTFHNDGSWYLEPTWSPDGSAIVFERSQAGRSDDGRVSMIHTVLADGSAEVALGGRDGHDDRQPSWSPAGDRILFQRRHLPDAPWDLWDMATDGSDQRNLSASPDADDSDGSWSPDGRWIVCSSDHGSPDSPVIAVQPAEPGPLYGVTCTPGRRDGAPSWSADGTWIAFESHPDEEASAAIWAIRIADNPCLQAPRPRRVVGRRVGGVVQR